MKDLRRNKFIDMLGMAEVIFEEKDNYISCDIPILGKVTYYPKADKLQINRNNKWEEGGLQYVKNHLGRKDFEYSFEQDFKVLEKKYNAKSDSELRNEFAGLAMQGICVNANRNSHTFNDCEEIAKTAFKIADEMIKRSKL